MGIRFYCPNGHKLNVKSYLAGKRGICPNCGAKLLIPEQSAGPAAASPGVPRMAATNELAGPEQPAGVVPANALPLASTGEVPGYEREFTITADAGSDIPLVDPIEENLQAVWYVRLSSGNQYGPAAGEVFRTWLNEGRVTPDCLVWREGWAEWQTASAVFPQLIR
jgi:hypothetical protein